MPSKKQYNLVQNDDYDTRIPLHSEEAFQHGIAFQAKYIGTLDVPRPTSRVEIVAAMRRIRYEFKAKGIKKKKVTVEVSVDGVRVTLRKKKKKKPWMDESSMVLMQHPVYRIFYVSHDSQDLKIFSYIARDGATNVFKCNVFKSNKKSQAMRVVRTVGQAFEVCHKLSVGGPPDDETTTADIAPSESHSDLLSDKPRKGVFAEGPASSADALAAAESLSTLDAGASDSPSARQRPLHLDIIPPPPNTHPTRRSPLSGGETYASPLSDLLKQSADASLPSAGTPLSAHHELQLMREQLEQQNQQTQAAVAQVHLLRDQLAAETAARLEAQARTHQLLVHNKELLDHISALVAHLQETERLQQQQHHQQQQQQQQQHVTSVPQSQMLDPQTPSLYLQDYPDLEALRQLTHGRLGQPYLQTGVPGSPHQQRNLFPNMFGLGLADQQFQNQLMQRLQNINTPYRQSQFYPDVGGLYSQQNTQTQSSPQFNLRVSQASSFTGSPVLSHRKDSEDDSPFIRPLSQVGTYTTTDTDGRTRVLVGSEEEQKEALRLDPPPSGVKKKEPALSGKRHDPLAAAMSSLRVSPEDDDIRRPASGAFHNGPFITRSTSEKVPNRSELMSQVQRTAWARHTTK